MSFTAQITGAHTSRLLDPEFWESYWMQNGSPIPFEAHYAFSDTFKIDIIARPLAPEMPCEIVVWLIHPDYKKPQKLAFDSPAFSRPWLFRWSEIDALVRYGTGPSKRMEAALHLMLLVKFWAPFADEPFEKVKDALVWALHTLEWLDNEPLREAIDTFFMAVPARWQEDVMGVKHIVCLDIDSLDAHGRRHLDIFPHKAFALFLAQVNA